MLTGVIWLWYALSILACYRLAQLFACDNGPFSVFARLRGVAKGSAREFMHCPYCLGIWLAALLALPVMWGQPLWMFAVYALAVAGGQAVLESLARCGQQEEDEYVGSE